MPELRLRLYDTLSANLVPLVPKRPGEVRIYTCGPTTYDVAHIGHARAALAPDILVRHVREQGLKVTYVRNITDVDDKILKRAEAKGQAPMDLSAEMAALYQEDIAHIGCLAPDVEPKVSQHIPEIVALIERLIAQGSAYELTMASGARDVYYAVRTFEGYGKLSKRNIDDLQVGARVEASDEKRDPLDFALWKGVVGDGWGWNSPWGKGRPGWHIECSAMSERYLGHGFDVHCGGMDLVFPHHENEIAQSEAAHPGEGPFASIWIHNGFVNVPKPTKEPTTSSPAPTPPPPQGTASQDERDKMSKSLGNFVTIRDVLARNDGEGLRYFLLTVHYRLPIGFDIEKLANGRVVFPGVIEAERRVDYLYQALGRLEGLVSADAQATSPGKLPKDLQAFAQLAADAGGRVDAALNDDLNTPVVLAVLGEVAKAANEFADLLPRRKKDAEVGRAAPFVAFQLARALKAAAAPLGLLQASLADYRERTQQQRLALLEITENHVEARIRERADARQQKDFARADVIRRELDALGIEVADSAEGTTFRVGLGAFTPPPVA